VAEAAAKVAAQTAVAKPEEAANSAVKLDMANMAALEQDN